MVKKLFFLISYVLICHHNLMPAAHGIDVPPTKADDAPSYLSTSAPTISTSIPKSVPIPITPQAKRYVSAGERFMQANSRKLASLRKKQSEQEE